MDRITIFNGLKYSIGFSGDLVDLYSLQVDQYKSIKGVERSVLQNAYESRIWVRIRGCEALYMGIDDGHVLLDVRPSSDVEILNAKQVERGVYHARIPVNEVERIWEERLPYLNFPFPENLERIEELNIQNL